MGILTQRSQVNMTVWLGAYVGNNETVNNQQQQYVLDALKIYGTDHVSGVTIGNESVPQFRNVLPPIR